MGITEYIEAEKIPGRDNENSLNITILERQYQLDSVNETRHQGPTLILVNPLRKTPIATAHVEPDGEPKLKAGVITGITFGAIVVAALFLTCLFWCCQGCCGGWQKNEVKRVRRQQLLREQREQQGQREQHTGGTVKMVGAVPVSARTGANSVSIGEDEIRVVEEQRVEQRRQEIVRAQTDEPPAYEAPPPRYMP